MSSASDHDNVEDDPTASDFSGSESDPAAEEDSISETPDVHLEPDDLLPHGISYGPGKDSLEIDPPREAEFAEFQKRYCHNIVHMGSLEAKTPPLPVTLGLEPLMESITEAAAESELYPYYSRLLSHLSFHLTQSPEDVLIFRQYPNTALRGIVQASMDNKPDLIAYFVPYDVAKDLSENDWDWRTLKPVHRKKVPTQKISSAAEIKMESPEMTVEVPNDLFRQSVRYAATLSRQNPASFLQYCFTADKTGFQLVALGLDECGIWSKVFWADGEWTGKLLTCLEMIISRARASFNPTNEAIPKVDRTFPVGSHHIATYSVTVGGKKFKLIPLFYGRANGRKPFVALAVADDNPKDIRVFKYSWRTPAQQGRERGILEQIHGEPGVVQIDTELSVEEVEKETPLKSKEEGGRTLGLIALKTVGRPLSSCRSVREFLAAMFDLIEVLRNLDQKGIIHRDISWGNVLIPFKLPETSDVLNEGNTSTEAALSNVDLSASMSRATAPNASSTTTNVEHTGNIRPCRFMSAIRGENHNEPRVILADFDHAINFNNSNADLKNVTGTPMFMAVDVLERRELGEMTLTGPGLDLRFLTSLNKSYPELYGDNVNEKNKWDQFYRDTLQNLGWITSLTQRDRELKDLEDELAGMFKHQAVHDVESIFYICVLFFARMWPKGAKIPESRKVELQRKRGKLFETLIDKRIGKATTNLSNPLKFIIEGVDIPEMKDFQEMLQEMWHYIKAPWYNVEKTGKGELYEYHSHDALRRILLRHIKNLDAGHDEIEVEENPLIMTIPRVILRFCTPTAFTISHVPSTLENLRDIRDDCPKSGQKRSSVPEKSGASKRARGSKDTGDSSRPAQDVTKGSTGENMIVPVGASSKWEVPKDFVQPKRYVELAWEVARSAAWVGL